MKELSIEEKAKAYDEALERAMKFLNKELFAENSECAIKHIFPELAESEDERIREYLIRYIDNTMKSSELKNKLLAWLEKQGEKKPQRIISAEAKEAMYNKPAWSEEDEVYLNTTIAYLKDAKEFKKTAENCIDWLKKLKQRIGDKL